MLRVMRVPRFSCSTAGAAADGPLDVLAQLAEGKGISREELKDGIIGQVEERLNEGLERLRENIDSIIDRTPGPPQASPTE